MANKTQSTSCCKKKRKLSIDRLSDLPDDVICHILSFLPTKKSVQTCILAKRWRSLWAHVPCFDFDFEEFRKGSTSTSMSRIINRFMLLRTKGVNIDTFHLKYHGISCNCFEFDAWIDTLIAHNVQNLSICLKFQFYLPRCLFSCKTLVDLRLRNCTLVIPMTGIVQLPSLKRLRLELVMYIESDSTLSNLISGCPVLKELIIELDSYRNPLRCCNISSPTLKRLNITSDSRCVGEKWYDVKLNTPSLKYLRLHGFVSSDIISPCRALTSLIAADVFFWKENRSVLEFVGKMYNVKCLSLSNCLVGVDVSTFSAVLTKKFHNLTNLVLEAADWPFISFFLENAENLQVLNIHMIDERIENWKVPKQVALCVSSHLRNVTIRDFGFKEAEFELVRYLLRNALVMKRMEIHLRRGDEDAVKRILKFCRGSEACVLVFHSNR